MVMARFGPEVARIEAEKAAREQIGPRQRILVGLADLTHAQPVVELALLIRDAAQRQPLYLVHGTRDEDGAGEQIGRAERMLQDAVGLCSSADVPAVTSTSTVRPSATSLAIRKRSNGVQSAAMEAGPADR